MTTAVRAYTLDTTALPEGGGGGDLSYPIVWATASFTGTRFDYGDFWAGGSPTRLTIPTTGYYMVGAAIDIGVAGQIELYACLRVNDTTDIVIKCDRTAPLGLRHSIAVSGDWYFTAGDYVELRMCTSNSSSENLSGDAAFSCEAWAVLIAGTQLGGASLLAGTSTAWSPSDPDKALTFDTVVYDDDEYFSLAAPTRLTIPRAGVYHLEATYASNLTSDVATTGEIYFRVNGTTTIGRNTGMASEATPPPPGAHIATLWYFEAGDYVELMGTPRSGWTTDTDDWPTAITISAMP